MIDNDVVDLGAEEVSLPPDPYPRAPSLRLPDGTWDMHCHVIGPTWKFPYDEAAKSKPPNAGVEELDKLHRAMGIENALIVQSVAHGSDHRVLLDALRYGAGRYRGVALLSEQSTDTEIAELNEAGVRGMRVHFVPELADLPDPSTIDRYVDVARTFNWHIELHLMHSGVLDYESLIASMGVPVVIDHMGRFDVDSPCAGDRLSALLRLLDTGHVWVKLSGVDRLSVEAPPFQDAVQVAATLAAKASERVLWGTDFPHPQSKGWTPSDAYRVELLEQIVPTEADRTRLLVENPLRFLNER